MFHSFIALIAGILLGLLASLLLVSDGAQLSEGLDSVISLFG